MSTSDAASPEPPGHPQHTQVAAGSGGHTAGVRSSLWHQEEQTGGARRAQAQGECSLESQHQGDITKGFLGRREEGYHRAKGSRREGEGGGEGERRQYKGG